MGPVFMGALGLTIISRSSDATPRPTDCLRASDSRSVALPFLGFFSPFPHGTCTLSVIEEYLGLEGGPPDSNTPRFTQLGRIEPG